MVATPARWASCGGGEVDGRARRTRPRPASRRYTPVRTLIRVDLPAPFWPISACTSPGCDARCRRRRSAGTPANDLSMPCIRSKGASAIALVSTGVGAERAGGRFLAAGPDAGCSVGARDVLRGVRTCRRSGPRAPAWWPPAPAGRTAVIVSKAFGPKRGLHSTVAKSSPASTAVRASLDAVDRDHHDVLARHLAGGPDRRDRAQRHLVVVGVDRGGVRVGLQQRLGHLPGPWRG